MQPASSHVRSLNAWERWRNIWHSVYYGPLLLTFVLTLADELALGTRIAVSGLVLAIALGYWLVIARHPEWWGQPRPGIALYFALTVILAHLLVELHPFFYLFAFSLNGHFLRLMPMRWALPSFFIVNGTFLLHLVRFSGWALLGNTPFLLMAAASLVLGLLFALWIHSIISQSHQRQNIIDELEATRRDLAAVERQAGILEERQRLARELHDTLAQGFTSIVMHLEAAEAVLHTDAAAVQRHLDQARHTARESLNDARRAVADLRPELLEQGSLPEALARLASQWADETGLAAAVTITGPRRTLPPEVEITLLRATQEALANIRKHARARAINVTLSFMEDAVALDIQDDGIGVDAARLSGETRQSRGEVRAGFGLRAMRERVEQLAGTLQVESASGEGTTIAIELPIRHV